jgi:hypothetical protein
MEEVEAVLRAVPDDDFGGVERVLYLAAVMTGMRRGELLGLRWGDIDWEAKRIRVRRNYVRGEFGPPKSRRSSRSVPLTDRLAGELQRHDDSAPFQSDEDLVFAHPHSRKPGTPLDGSKVLKRFKAALRGAGVRVVPRIRTMLAAALGRFRRSHPMDRANVIANVTDPDGRRVELTAERWQHIMRRDGHPELSEFQTEVLRAVRAPDIRLTAPRANEQSFLLRDVGPSRWLQVVVAYAVATG